MTTTYVCDIPRAFWFDAEANIILSNLGYDLIDACGYYAITGHNLYEEFETWAGAIHRYQVILNIEASR